MAVACMDASCCCHCRFQCLKLLERQQGGWTRPGGDDPAPFTVHLQLDRVVLGSDHCHQLWMQHCSAMDGHMCSNSAQLRLLLHKALEFAGGQHAIAGRQACMDAAGSVCGAGIEPWHLELARALGRPLPCRVRPCGRAPQPLQKWSIEERERERERERDGGQHQQ
jgi:hypothetical protein